MGLLDKMGIHAVLEKVKKTAVDFLEPGEEPGSASQPVSAAQNYFCTNCGTKLDPGAKFCKNCGKAVSVGATYIPREAENAAAPNPAAEQPPQPAPEAEQYEHEHTQRKTVYEGMIHKCPHCGEVVDSFITHCPTCGHELRDVKASSSVREFAEQLADIDTVTVSDFSNASTTPTKKSFSVMRMIFGSDFSDAVDGISDTDKNKMKIGLIKNFPIPNTVEDITEFVILAASNIDLKAYGADSEKYKAERALSDAWLSKMEQAYQKAKILFPETLEFKRISNIIENKLNDLSKKKKQKTISEIWPFLLLVAMLILFLIIALVNS